MRDEAAHHHVVLPGAGRGPPLAAAILRAERLQRRALDVAVAGQRDDHHPRLDQALVVHVADGIEDLRHPRRRDLGADSDQFLGHHLHAADAAAKDVQQRRDALADLGQLGGDLVALQSGQPVQRQRQDAAGLRIRQSHRAFVGDDVARVLHQRQQRADIAGGPVAAHQRGAGRGRVRAGADDADDLVDIGHRDGQADQQMAAFPRLVQPEAAAAQDHFLAELDEGHQRLAQAHLLRAAVVQRQEVDREGRLQLRHAVELVQHHLRRGVTLQLDHHAHAVAVGFVAQVRDALDRLGADQLGDLLHQGRLVDLVGNLGGDNLLPAAAHLLDLALRAQGNAATPRLEGAADAGAAEDQPAGGEVRPGDDLHQPLKRGAGLADQLERGVDDLGGVVRGYVRCHADSDAAGAIDQQVREGGRKHLRLALALVVVRLELDGVFLDPLKQRGGRLRQPHLGIAHGRRRVAVHAAEIALAVDQRHAQREGLRHADHGVVDRGVAVRVVLTHHVADHAGGFAVRLVRGVAAFLHGVEDAPVHRLQPVPRIRQGARDDDAHGIGEVGGTHLLLKPNRHGIHGPGCVAGAACGFTHAWFGPVMARPGWRRARIGGWPQQRP